MVGIGGLSFLALVVVLFYLVRNFVRDIATTLKGVEHSMYKVKEGNAVNNQILLNNTKALEELAKSNNNVAGAIELLKSSICDVKDRMETVNENIIEMDKKVLLLELKLDNISKN